MTTRTGDQLARRTLEILNVVPKGVSPSAVDMEFVKDNWQELAQLLRVREIFADDDDEIPLEAFQALAVLLAEPCAPRFGKSAPNTAGAIRMLSEIYSETESGENIEVEYF